MKTLLEKAKKVKIGRKSNNLTESATNEQIELAIGWAKGEITMGQASRVLYGSSSAGKVGGKILYAFACWLRAGIERGIIKVK